MKKLCVLVLLVCSTVFVESCTPETLNENTLEQGTGGQKDKVDGGN